MEQERKGYARQNKTEEDRVLLSLVRERIKVNNDTKVITRFRSGRNQHQFLEYSWPCGLM
jgi:hypothetical protein